MKTAACLSTLAIVGAAGFAQADDATINRNLTLGIGAQVMPEYEGARKSLSGLVPVVNARRGRFILDGGLYYAVTEGESGSLAVGLTYDDGRRDKHGRYLTGTGSDYLKGLGRIDAAAVANVMAHRLVGPVDVNAGISRWVNNSGFMTADLGATLSAPLTERLNLGFSLNGIWANDAYMHSYFGVSQQQAAASRFQRYNADSGVKNISASVQANYFISPKWTAVATVIESRLLGDAARSPVVQQRDGLTASVTLEYHFGE
jgi:outer membrane protein